MLLLQKQPPGFTLVDPFIGIGVTGTAIGVVLDRARTSQGPSASDVGEERGTSSRTKDH